MSASDLASPLLHSGSRLFELGIRLLPSDLRQPIGLAYLLVRASHGIAESSEGSAQTRFNHLATFSAAVKSGDLTQIAEFQKTIRSPKPPDNPLLARLSECLSALAAINAANRELIRSLLKEVTTGYLYDLLRFGDAEEIRMLETAGALEQYTCFLGGCVGEFWTDVCLHYYPWLSRLPTGEVRELSVNYGKALKSVDILNDLPKDLERRRCYLPLEGIEPTALIVTPQQARPDFDRWRRRAEHLLDSGRKYTASLRPARLRAACFFPWEIGRRTLQLLAAESPLETIKRVKLSPNVIGATLLRTGLAAFSNRPLAA